MIVMSGASRGIGYFLMQKFLMEGAEVIGLYNKSLPKENIALMHKVDVSNLEEVETFTRINNDKLSQLTLIS